MKDDNQDIPEDREDLCVMKSLVELARKHESDVAFMLHVLTINGTGSSVLMLPEWSIFEIRDDKPYIRLTPESIASDPELAKMAVQASSRLLANLLAINRDMEERLMELSRMLVNDPGIRKLFNLPDLSFVFNDEEATPENLKTLEEAIARLKIEIGGFQVREGVSPSKSTVKH